MRENGRDVLLLLHGCTFYRSSFWERFRLSNLDKVALHHGRNDSSVGISEANPEIAHQRVIP